MREIPGRLSRRTRVRKVFEAVAHATGDDGLALRHEIPDLCVKDDAGVGINRVVGCLRSSQYLGVIFWK